MPDDPRLFARLRAHASLPLAALAVGTFAFVALDTARHTVIAAPADVARLLPQPDAASRMPLPLALPLTPPADQAPPKATIETFDPMAPPPPATPVTVENSEDLATLFENHDYTLDNVVTAGREVPAIAVTRMPGDLAKVPEVEKRKRLFIKALLPVVLQVNEEITADRQRLVWLRMQMESGEGLSATDAEWLEALAERYKTDAADYGELLRRVDVVPPALAISQAVTESGWGTSWTARKGNALFGQYHISSKSARTVAGAHVPGTFQVRAFDNVVQSVAAYASNLNTHHAYRKFRKQRADMRDNNGVIDGYVLAGQLLAYSERGQDYVDFLRLIMRTENLRPLDEARLQRF